MSSHSCYYKYQCELTPSTSWKTSPCVSISSSASSSFCDIHNKDIEDDDMCLNTTSPHVDKLIPHRRRNRHYHRNDELTNCQNFLDIFNKNVKNASTKKRSNKNNESTATRITSTEKIVKNDGKSKQNEYKKICCCSHASTSQQFSNMAENSWNDSSVPIEHRRIAQFRRLPTSRLCDLSTTCRHVACNMGHRKCIDNVNISNLNGAISYDKNLAAAADTYFYFYSGVEIKDISAKCQKLSTTKSRECPSVKSNHFTILNQVNVRKILKRIATGTRYRTYFEDFVSIRLCKSCQIRWGSCLNISSSTKKLQQRRLNGNELQSNFGKHACNISWIPSIVDFTSSSSTSSSSSSSSSSLASLNSKGCEESCSINSPYSSEIKHLTKKKIGNHMLSLLDKSYNAEQRDSPENFKMPLQSKGQNAQHKTNLDNVFECRRSLFKFRAIFCPILTKGSGNKRSIVQHCCGCHNFTCTTYPDKMSYILSCDNAASAYVSKMMRLVKDEEYCNKIDEQTEDIEYETFLPLNQSLFDSPLNPLAIEKECLRRFLHMSLFCLPNLSFRLQVFNPHPTQYYCQDSDCLFCTFKRERQPDDEAAMNEIQTQLYDIRSALSEKITGECHVGTSKDSVNDEVLKSKIQYAKSDALPVTTTMTTEEYDSNMCDSDRGENHEKRTPNLSPNITSTLATTSTSIFTIPLLAIEEKILKLIKRFYNDPKEPNAEERCNACCTRRASVRAYPCGHQILCRLCSVTIIKKIFETKSDVMKCILCRQQVAVLRHQKRG